MMQLVWAVRLDLSRTYRPFLPLAPTGRANHGANRLNGASG